MSGSGLRVFGTFGVVVWLLGATVAGCGGGESDATRKRIASLQDEVGLLQNSVDRLEERLAAVESRPLGPAREAGSGASADPATTERPRLRVIRVEPGAADVAVDEPTPPKVNPAEPEDPQAPRPIIRGSGSRVETELPSGPTSRLERSHLPTRARDRRMGHTACERGREQPREA